jgi:hypothetical protein
MGFLRAPGAELLLPRTSVELPAQVRAHSDEGGKYLQALGLAGISHRERGSAVPQGGTAVGRLS